MTKREKRGIVTVFLFFLLLAVYQDCTGGNLQKDGLLEREDSNGDEKGISLILNAEGIFEEYEYELTLEPAKVTKEEAERFFQQAIEEIAIDFQEITQVLPVKDKYCDDMVKADWQFVDREYVNLQGEIVQENIPQAGIVCVAEVTLSCGAYEEIFSFPFQIQKKELSQQEVLLQELEQWVVYQMEQEGQTRFQLPTELNGVSLEWKEQKESRTLQVLCMEVAAGFLLLWGSKKQREQKEKSRVQAIEMQYPDVVNQLAMLLEAGMTTRQAWNKIAMQYERKRKQRIVDVDVVMEAVVRMNRRLQEGESERMVYEKFEAEVNARCYSRLVRTITSHLDKGTAGLCTYLEEECRQAYEQRILAVKKMGEEASTKMLLPLMLMMILVMVIVLLPAIIEIAV